MPCRGKTPINMDCVPINIGCCYINHEWVSKLPPEREPLLGKTHLVLLRSLQASACPRVSLCARCKHENSESKRTHGAREAPNQALGAWKPHLDGLFRCRQCGSGQVRCGRPGGTGTRGGSGSETRPMCMAQNSGECARAALRARHQQQNQHTVAENGDQALLNPRGRQRAPLQQPCTTGGSCKHGFTSAAAPRPPP